MEPREIFDIAERNVEKYHRRFGPFTFGVTPKCTKHKPFEHKFNCEYVFEPRDDEPAMCLVGAVVAGIKFNDELPGYQRYFEVLTGQCYDCALDTFDEGEEDREYTEANIALEHAEHFPWREEIRKWKQGLDL